MSLPPATVVTIVYTGDLLDVLQQRLDVVSFQKRLDVYRTLMRNTFPRR